MKITGYSDSKPPVTHIREARIYAKPRFQRIDFLGRKSVSIIFDFAKGKTWELDPLKRVAVNNANPQIVLPYKSCKTSDIKECFKGAKLTGNDVVNGHPCEIYERDTDGKDPVKMKFKIWHPTDLKEIEAIKYQFFNDERLVGSVEILDIERAAQDDSLFEVPQNYSIQTHR